MPTSRWWASSSPHWSRRRRPRSPSRCTATCPPGRSGCPRCGRATSSTRSPTFPRASGPRSCATGSPRTARAWWTTTCWSRSRAGRTPCWPTCSSTTCSIPRSPRRTSRRSATSRRRTPSPRIRWWPRRSYRRTCGLRSSSRNTSKPVTGRWNSTRTTTPPGTTSGTRTTPADPDTADARSNQVADARSNQVPVARSRERPNRLWPLLAAPGVGWLLLFFLAPLYVVLAIVFGQRDPVFRTAVPVWNPLQWDATQFTYVLSRIGPDGIYFPALVRTVVYVGAASILCLCIAFPVAYYVSRLAGKYKGVLIALLIAPFWISYMMRMLAWVNLLQNDGLVNRILRFGGLFDVNVDWLTGQSVVVVLGLAYGYVPYMILPLYAGLDRLSQSMLEASRDLGASRVSSFLRVTLPMCRPTILAAVLLTCLPMLGDYFTNDLLSASPKTAMVGNLINDSVQAPGQTGQAGAFVMLVLIATVVPMIYYVRVTLRGDEVRT